MEEWVDITTIDQAGLYEVNLEIYTNRYRYRKKYNNGMWSDWINGHPSKDELEQA
ncbi:MAG: hypothetical protein PVG39_30340 [Desulfobacteraceae bacterium]|jgi:hypothetical protein